MLILTRNVGQRIIINDDLILTVLAHNRHNQLRLGFEAPPGYRIDREEIYWRKIAGIKERSEKAY